MERLNPRARSDAYGSKLHRDQSVVVATVLPWITIALASVIPQFVIATALPLIPPLGFMMLLAWRLARPGLLPVWAGFPLGLIDDLYSGQPFGFAILAWSGTMLGLEVLESRFPWRTFAQDWFTAGLILLVYLACGTLLSGAVLSRDIFIAMGPQFVFSIFAYPVVARLVARLDVLRLWRWRTVR